MLDESFLEHSFEDSFAEEKKKEFLSQSQKEQQHELICFCFH